MRRRHRRITAETELDITSFMNLMIVLVPVLLLSMVFAQNSIIQLSFPLGPAADAMVSDQDFQLQVVVRETHVSVADSRGGLIAKLDDKDGQPDLLALRDVLKQVKGRVPEKKDVALLLEPGTPYQTLVSIMDTVRSYEAVVAANVVDAELFPDISLGDAPKATEGAP